MTNWKEMYKDLSIEALYEELDDCMDLIDKKSNLLKESDNLHRTARLYHAIGTHFEQMAVIEELIDEKEN